MLLAKVIGTVVSTAKHREFAGKTLLICRGLDEEQALVGNSFLAVDHSQAGVGDTVLVLREGNGIRQLLRAPSSPVRALVVGIVDHVEASAHV